MYSMFNVCFVQSAPHSPSRCSRFRIILLYVRFRNKEGGRNKDKTKKNKKKRKWENLYFQTSARECLIREL